ncbi:toxin VasX [Vibrio quintilis]|nr:toxin VasX [Vibrio quintilis]
MQAFLPLTLLPTFDKNIAGSRQKDKERTAPVRNGYLYIAYNGQIWREVAVTATDDGLPCFKDVHLLNYREGYGKPFKTNTRREATGQPLKEIWYPSRADGKRTEIRIAFSEVPWSGSRLNYLEANPDALKARMQKPDYEPMLLDELKEVRAREPELEMLLGEPKDFSQDLAGSWLSGEYEQIKSDIQAAMDDGATAVSQYKNEIANKQDKHRYDFMLRMTARNELITEGPAESPEWDQISGVGDYLADGKARKLRGIIFDDPLFELRHLTYLVRSGIGEMSVLLNDAASQKYFKSAELVQRFIIPAKWGETKNQYHKYMGNRGFDSSPGGVFRRTTRLTERMLLFTRMNELQKKLSRALDKKALAVWLKDIASMDDANAAAAYKIVGNAVSALRMELSAVDTLGIGEKGYKRKHPYSSQLVRLLENDRSHPLHEVLFPENGEVPMDEAYTAEADENDGSGLCTAAGLARWGDENLLIQPEQLEVFEMGELYAEGAGDNGEGEFATERRIAGMVNGFLKDYFDAITEIALTLSKTKTQSVSLESVYVPIMSTLKASGPTAFGQLELTEAGKVKQNYVVIGVEGGGLKNGLTEADRKLLHNVDTNKSKSVRLFDSEGKLVLTSNRKAALKAMQKQTSGGADMLGKKGAFTLIVAPADTAVVNAYNKPATKRTLADYAKSKAIADAYEKLNIPRLMVGIEVLNLMANKQYFENIIELKDIPHSAANVFSAVLDFSVALAHSANMALGAESRFAKAIAKKTFIKIPASKLVGRAFSAIGLKLTFTKLVVASFVADVLTGSIGIYEAFQLKHNNDMDAAAAMMTFGVGATFAALGNLAAEGSFLSAACPWAFVIAIVGGVLYIFLKDTPLETWLANGPFASYSPGDDYRYLDDPDAAFERLLGLLIRFDISMYALGKDTQMAPEIQEEWQQAGVTHVLWARSNLSQLFNRQRETDRLYIRQGVMEHKSRLHDTASRTEFIRTHTMQNIDNFNDTPLKTVQSEDGALYGYRHSKTIPPDRKETKVLGIPGMKRELYHYEPGFVARAQFVINDISFPLPPLDEAEPQDDPSGEPDFSNDEDQSWIHCQLPKIKEE